MFHPFLSSFTPSLASPKTTTSCSWEATWASSALTPSMKEMSKIIETVPGLEKSGGNPKPKQPEKKIQNMSNLAHAMRWDDCHPNQAESFKIHSCQAAKDVHELKKAQDVVGILRFPSTLTHQNCCQTFLGLGPQRWESAIPRWKAPWPKWEPHKTQLNWSSHPNQTGEFNCRAPGPRPWTRCRWLQPGPKCQA